MKEQRKRMIQKERKLKKMEKKEMKMKNLIIQIYLRKTKKNMMNSILEIY